MKIKLDNDWKLKSQSFEAEYNGYYTFGSTEREAYENMLKHLNVESCEYERTYDVEKLIEVIEQHNLFYNPRFSDFLKIDFI